MKACRLPIEAVLNRQTPEQMPLTHDARKASNIQPVCEGNGCPEWKRAPPSILWSSKAGLCACAGRLAARMATVRARRRRIR